MRIKVISVLVVAMVLAVVYILLRPSLVQSRQGVIELTNLPDQYCPTTASVIVTEVAQKNPKIFFNKTTGIDECRYVVLGSLTGLRDGSQQVFVKLPGALAFRVSIDSINGHYQYAPSLGDVNDDNVIDSTDESQVVRALFSIDPTTITTNDLDQDKKVSVMDLSLTRINRRAGVARPDKQSWSTL